MSSEGWKRIEALYHAAHALPAGERDRFLAGACPDEEIRREVDSLLNEPDPEDGFLVAPVIASPEPGTMVAVMTGRVLAGYEVQDLLGAGGMGEVYRARDAALGRDVAIKILPLAFTSDADRLARFEREARMLAALNHPNVCGIHGLQESEGIRFLVLELADGETLAGRLDRVRPRAAGLPMSEALDIARQIASGLEAAHERGIIHRDLKPANIMISPGGVVKVLDFGLAKTVRGEQSAPDLTSVPAASEGTRAGPVMGTAAYMSPEQARGLPVDRRSDIWAFGCLLYQMLTGQVAFAGETASDTIARILEREPDWTALPPGVPAAIRRLLALSLAKDPKKRLRDIGDVRLEIEAIADARAAPPDAAPTPAPASRRAALVPWALLVLFTAAIGIREIGRRSVVENPLPSSGFRLLTTWPGNEAFAEISPDGKVVAFLGDRDEETDVFAGPVNGASFENLTTGVPPLNPVAIFRPTGFSGDSARVWFGVKQQRMDVPWSGGTPAPFLVKGAQAPAWSTDGRLVYFDQNDGDALWMADAAGRNAYKMAIDWPPGTSTSPHNHNMIWSSDNQWIYFVHGTVRDWNHQGNDMDIWRVRPSGGPPQRLTFLNASLTFLAMLDQRTLIFVAPAEDGSGSWLWTLRLREPRFPWLRGATATPQRIDTGLEQYTSVSASRDGSLVVATRAAPTATLWTLPIPISGVTSEEDVRLLPVETERALAPRYARKTAVPLLFYLSARGTGDRLWGFETKSFEVTRGTEGHLVESPAPSPDGARVAIVVKEGTRHHLAVMNRDGQGSQALATSIDIDGGIDWSPDGRWIAAAGEDPQGNGLFLIPVDGGAARRIWSATAGDGALDPVWSPRGDLIVFSGLLSGGSATTLPGAPLMAVRPDGRPHALPRVTADGTSQPLLVTPGGYRFLDATRIVYRPRPEPQDFWLLDLVTGERRQMTKLSNKGSLRGFDITPDGKRLVFDRVQQNSDIVLIDRGKR